MSTEAETTEALLAQADYYDEQSKLHVPANFQVNGPKVDLICAALAQCQGELKHADFDATNPFFKSKYATLGAVIAASREALAKNGLAMLQIPTIHGSLVSVHTRIVHKSGQSLDCGVMSLPLGESDRNSDAQMAGSILTYLKRYAWASVLGIYADTDDDGNSGPKGAVPRQNATPSATQGTAKPDVVAKIRMKALNLLQAAPGQPNRQLVKDFLYHKQWIGAKQEPEDWMETHLPKSPAEMRKIGEDIASFEMRQRQQAQADLAEDIAP